MTAFREMGNAGEPSVDGSSWPEAEVAVKYSGSPLLAVCRRSIRHSLLKPTRKFSIPQSRLVTRIIYVIWRILYQPAPLCAISALLIHTKPPQPPRATRTHERHSTRGKYQHQPSGLQAGSIRPA